MDFDPPAPNGRFYRSGGCRKCFGTGYRGRIGVFEIAVCRDGALRRSDDGSYELALQYTSLADNCRRLVREGVTTVEEALRVMNSIGV